MCRTVTSTLIVGSTRGHGWCHLRRLPPPPPPPPPTTTTTTAAATVVFEGAGISYITVEPGSAYLVRSKEENFDLVHKTGPRVPDASDHKPVKRLAAIFGGHFRGDPTRSEHELLEKGTNLSHLYHYGYQNQGGVARTLVPREKKIVYTQPEDQVNADELIDTLSRRVPEIPHGPMQKNTWETLKKAATKLRKGGSMVIFSGIDSTMERETIESGENVKEAYDNMKEWPWSKSGRSEYNDFEKVDPSNPQSRTVRSVWTDLARSIASNIGVYDAESFQLLSVRLVDTAALQFHLDQLGFGPSVMVAVVHSDACYRVDFAYAKEGRRGTGLPSKRCYTDNLICAHVHNSELEGLSREERRKKDREIITPYSSRGSHRL